MRETRSRPSQPTLVGAAAAAETALLPSARAAAAAPRGRGRREERDRAQEEEHRKAELRYCGLRGRVGRRVKWWHLCSPGACPNRDFRRYRTDDGDGVGPWTLDSAVVGRGGFGGTAALQENTHCRFSSRPRALTTTEADTQAQERSRRSSLLLACCLFRRPLLAAPRSPPLLLSRRDAAPRCLSALAPSWCLSPPLHLPVDSCACLRAPARHPPTRSLPPPHHLSISPSRRLRPRPPFSVSRSSAHVVCARRAPPVSLAPWCIDDLLHRRSSTVSLFRPRPPSRLLADWRACSHRSQRQPCSSARA